MAAPGLLPDADRHRIRHRRGRRRRVRRPAGPRPFESRRPHLRRRRPRGGRVARRAPAGERARRSQWARRHGGIRRPPERPLPRPRHRPRARRQRRGRAGGRRIGRADHHHQSPDRRAGLRRRAGAALDLRDPGERVWASARRPVHRAHEVRVLLPIDESAEHRPPAVRSSEPAHGRRHDDHRPRRDRAVHRAARDGCHRPRLVRDRGAVRSGAALGPLGAAARLERQGDLALRRRQRHRPLPERAARRARRSSR